MRIIVVAFETFRKHFFSKSFLAMLLVPVVLVVFFILLLGNKQKKIDIISNDYEIYKIEQSSNSSLFFKGNKNEADAKDRLSNGKTIGYLKIDLLNNNIISAKLYGSKISNDSVDKIKYSMQKIQSQLNYKNARLNKTQIEHLNNKFIFKYKNKSAKDNLKPFYINLITGLSMYLVIIVYSSIFAQEIGSEKGNKVMEMILSKIPGNEYFYGKLFGMLLLLIFNLLFYFLFFILIYIFKDKISYINVLTKNIGSIFNRQFVNNMLIDVILVILGVLLFLLVSSFTGICISKQEDISKATMPVSLLVMVLYFLSFWTLTFATPVNSLTKLLSIVPFTSSFFMPIWLSIESVPIWIVLLSIFMGILTVVILSILFSKFYTILSLYNGNKPIKHLFKNLLSNNA